MTKKDYELIAGAFRAAIAARHLGPYFEPHPSIYTEARFHACFVADALASDNPRFDRERFLKACGVEA